MHHVLRKPREMCKKPVKRTETREENRFHKTEAAEALRREMKHCVEELFSDDPLQQLDRGKFSNYIHRIIA